MGYKVVYFDVAILGEEPSSWLNAKRLRLHANGEILCVEIERKQRDNRLKISLCLLT
jgi:hypothetical protein